jgi:signal transduction histidine kinase
MIAKRYPQTSEALGPLLTKIGSSSSGATPLFAGRGVLWAGCAIIIAVLCISTADIVYSLRQTSVESDAVISAFRQRTHLLDQLRALMTRSALAPDSGDRAIEANELPEAHEQANHLLENFRELLGSADDAEIQQRLAHLKTSVDAYWSSLPAIREQNERLPPSAQPSPGSSERTQIRRIARQIGALNREQQDRAEEQLHAEQNLLQRKLVISSSLTLLIVVALISGISYRVGSTERHAEAQYKEIVEARAELRNFATQLEHAQEEERRKLSHELHDEFGQTMAAALFELSRIENEMIHDDGTRAHLSRVKQELESSVRSVRDIALALRPSMLDDLGLIPALRWQGREVARRSELVVRVEAEDNGEALPDAYRTCIYRIVQEGLHNVVKHAFATSVVVIFKWAGDKLLLTIEDDGKGFTPASEKGMGLLGIEERVARLSGNLEVESSPGKGTTLRVILPAPTAIESEPVL